LNNYGKSWAKVARTFVFVCDQVIFDEIENRNWLGDMLSGQKIATFLSQSRPR
jgi:hypothetical protein